jgi:hypothetical protein
LSDTVKVPGKRVHAMHSATFGFALIVSTAACYGGSFQCETNEQCSGNGVAGMCQPDHFCSFADATCPSGQRYGDSSGGNSGLCVGGGGPGPDGGPGSEGFDAQLCFGGAMTICLTQPPTMPLTLPATINTDTDCQQTVDQTTGPALCVLAGSMVTVNLTRATGSRPLVVIAATTLEIDNALDVSSINGSTGAAANPADCSMTGMTGANDQGGGGGGAGGSFSSSGGAGGHGDDNNNGQPAGQAPGGNPNATSVPTTVRGGCKGGGGGDAGAGGSTGGDGGGAMYLIAGSHIAVNGGAFASGAGGPPGPSCAGGGGGGSGGLVGLDAPTIDVTGEVSANGGAGGGGGGTSNAGQRGGDGTTTAYDQKATGGNPGTTGGGNGGDGTTLGSLTGETGTKGDCGGGGGGGGVGYVWVHGTVTGNRISPAPTTH